MSVKKEAKRSAIEVAADEEGKGEQTCGLRVYWQFARDTVDYQMMKRPVWKNIVFLFGIKDEMMVTISERFKSRPVKSRMSAFEDRFSMT